MPRDPILSPVERVSEMLFGLYMALTFVGAVSVVEPEADQVRTLFIGAVGCNLAWGLVDAVMFLVRTLAERGRTLALALAVRSAATPEEGRAHVTRALSSVAAQLVSATEIEAVRARIVALPALPERPVLHRRDALAGIGIFLIVVGSTFPVVLPFLFIADVAIAKNLSRAIALVMLFLGGLGLGRYAGAGGLRTGFMMVGLGAALTVAIIALGG